MSCDTAIKALCDGFDGSLGWMCGGARIAEMHEQEVGFAKAYAEDDALWSK